MTHRNLVSDPNSVVDWQDFTDNKGNVIDDPLIEIIHLTGDDYETAVDEINALGGSTRNAVEYLSHWDYGTETDHAASVNGVESFDRVTRTVDRFNTLTGTLHEAIIHGGIEYILTWDHRYSIYALYRRPMVAE